MSQQLEPLPELVQRWIDDDPDPATRQRLQQLLDSGLEQELRERMGPQPRFGTAGVRAVMGAGRARMNCALVRRLALALAHVLERSPHQRHSICVGFDARHRSEDFAREAAGVLAARGHLVRFFDRPVPTPLLAYSSTRLDAAAGLMFTASHNAPEYNGAKLYREGGRQVLPPYADQLMQEMSSIDAVRDLKVLREDEARALGCWENLGEAQE